MRAPLSDDAVGPPSAFLPIPFRYSRGSALLLWPCVVGDGTETQVQDWSVCRSPFGSRRFPLMRYCRSEASRNAVCQLPMQRAPRTVVDAFPFFFFFLFLVTHRNLESVVSGGASSACAVLAWPLHGVSLQTRRFSFKGM